jgi:hypothetical protein
MADFGKLIERSGKTGGAPNVLAATLIGYIGKPRVRVVLLIVSLSAVALWFGLNTAGRLARVEQGLAQLSQRAGAEQARVGDDDLLQAQMRDLAARVNDLAVIIEGPFSHLRQSNEESLSSLTQRLERLEREAVARSGAPLPVTASATQSGVTVPSATTAEGGWVINLISLSSEKDAREQMLRLRKAGVRVEMQHAQHDGKSWYRLRVPGFTNYEGARAYIETVEKQAGVENAWVAKE